MPFLSLKSLPVSWGKNYKWIGTDICMRWTEICGEICFISISLFFGKPRIFHIDKMTCCPISCPLFCPAPITKFGFIFPQFWFLIFTIWFPNIVSIFAHCTWENSQIQESWGKVVKNGEELRKCEDKLRVWLGWSGCRSSGRRWWLVGVVSQVPQPTSQSQAGTLSRYTWVR